MGKAGACSHMYTQGPATADTCDMSAPAACCLLLQKERLCLCSVQAD